MVIQKIYLACNQQNNKPYVWFFIIIDTACSLNLAGVYPLAIQLYGPPLRGYQADSFGEAIE
jgi:hypothetical protein